MITDHMLAVIANLLAILAVVLAIAYHAVAVNVRQVEQKRQE
jgi:cell division protein FtsB